MDFIQTIKDLDAIEYISKYVRLKRKGNVHSGLCPFHSEKTPSFTVFKKTNSFKCFGCGASGSIIDFSMKINSLEFMDAAKAIAQEYNIEIPKSSPKDEAEKKIIELRLHFYRTALKKVPEALEYLTKRGFSQEDIDSFQIGFAPTQETLLYEYLCAKIPNSEDAIKKHLGNQRGLDFFKGRIVLPITNVAGKVIAFQCRAISNDIHPKYLHSSESSWFNKSKVLYGLDKAKMSKEKYCILLEGNMDVIRMHQIGKSNSVCSMGTAFTQEQAKLLKNYFSEIVICFDGDNAGKKAAISALQILLDEDFDVKILKLPDGEDADTYFLKNDFDTAKPNTLGWLEYLFSLTEAINDDDGAKISAFNRILSICENIKPEIRRKHYVSKCRKKIDSITNSENAFFKNDIRKQYISCMIVFGTKVITYLDENGNTLQYSIYDSMRANLIENEVFFDGELEGVYQIIISNEFYYNFFIALNENYKSLYIESATSINAVKDLPELSFKSTEDFPDRLSRYLEISILIYKLKEDNKSEKDSLAIVSNNKIIEQLTDMLKEVNLFD
jgi:DNA primase